MSTAIAAPRARRSSPGPGRAGAANELWALNGDGSIASALGTSLYLAPDPNGDGLIISNSAYYWVFSGNGAITDDNDNVVTAGVGQGAAVTLAPAQSGAASQSWWAAPNMLAIPKNFRAWRYITSTVTDANNTTFVLNIDGNVDAPNTSIIVWQLEANSRNSMWQITNDGRILSALDRSLLMGLSSSDGGPLVTQSATSGESGQNWNFAPSGLIQNQDTGLYLGINGNPSSLWPDSGPQAVAATLDGTPPPSMLWQLAPSNPLNAIIMQAPLAFPAFTGDEGKAFDDIMGRLSIVDIRSEYTNLSVDLSDWQTTIDGMTPAPGVDPTLWGNVVSQLDREITAANSVRAFFQEFSNYQSSLSTESNDRLTQLGALAGLEQGDSTNIGGLILSIFEAILYTVLEAVPGGAEAVSLASVVGNVMEGSVNVASSAMNVDQAISPDPFEVAYADLWGQIASAYGSTLDASNLTQTILLSDWGKMNAFYAAATTLGPNTLSWPSGQTAALVDDSIPGFEIAVLQMLLPAKFQIYFYPDDDDDPVDDVPSEAQWVTEIKSGLWMKYWIAAQDIWEAYPDADLLNTYVWGNGVSQADFFQSRNGWGFATAWWGKGGPDKLLVTINNQTPNVLTLSIAASEGWNAGYLWPGGSTLAPYGSTMQYSVYSGGLETTITVNDAAGNQVAAFTMHMHEPFISAGDVWVDGQSSSGGYSLSSPICNSGSVAHNFSGAAQITVSYSDS